MRAPYEIFLTNQPMNTSFTSEPFLVWQLAIFSIQITWSGNAYGVLSLEYSSDPNSGDAYPENWTVDPASLVTLNGDGSWLWNFPNPGFFWVRLVYVDTSGGTASAVITAATFTGKGA